MEDLSRFQQISMRFFRVAVLLIVSLFVLGGCISAKDAEPDPDKDPDHTYFKPPAKDKIKYEQISSQGCELNLVGSEQVSSGSRCVKNFMLSNRSQKKVDIKEWYMVDQYNFAVYYRRLPADKPLNPSTPFRCYRVRIPAKPRPVHSELHLLPGSIAELEIEMPFIEELNPGEKAEFEVYVATTLETFKLRSPTYMLIAR